LVHCKFFFTQEINDCVYFSIDHGASEGLTLQASFSVDLFSIPQVGKVIRNKSKHLELLILQVQRVRCAIQDLVPSFIIDRSELRAESLNNRKHKHMEFHKYLAFLCVSCDPSRAASLATPNRKITNQAFLPLDFFALLLLALMKSKFRVQSCLIVPTN